LHNTKPQQANKVKNYGQTIQQSRKSETPEQLHQTQKSRDQRQESSRYKKSLTGRFEQIEKAAHSGGLFDYGRVAVSAALIFVTARGHHPSRFTVSAAQKCTAHPPAAISR
jgi:hypothetical protein